jgi:hypothetical protein
VLVVKAGLAYFALVFGAGFALGLVRVPILVPRLGERVAELLEMPVMLVVIVFAARFVVGRFALATSLRAGLGAGIVALACLVAAELALVSVVQGRSLAQYIAGRDPVAGTVYLAMLALYAVMPLLVSRTRRRRQAPAHGQG